MANQRHHIGWLLLRNQRNRLAAYWIRPLRQNLRDKSTRDRLPRYLAMTFDASFSYVCDDIGVWETILNVGAHIRSGLCTI